MEWLYVFIPSLVTVIGFGITIYLNRVGLRDEISKVQQNISLDRIADVPYEISEMLTSVSKGELDVTVYSSIISKVVAYGSADSVKILETMQIYSYSLKGKKSSEIKGKEYDIIIYTALLLSQIKLDLTGKIIKPLSWIRIRINDANLIDNIITNRINEIIIANDFEKQFSN
jgi:hypothetical protein